LGRIIKSTGYPPPDFKGIESRKIGAKKWIK